MQPQTFIFLGPSGCGKGTQAKLLQEEIKKKYPEQKIIYIETGEGFRKLTQTQSFTSQRVKKILDQGELVPEFMPIYIWTKRLVEELSPDVTIFFDGTPRKLGEAYILSDALKFYERENPMVISINASNEWVTKLMKDRGRTDDNEEDIKNRLDWFKEKVLPTVEYLKNNHYYKFIEINGEQTIDEVHKEIISKIGL
ncbi:MAG: nucleoside monophosphate kinase [Candidatus Zambryskibacteria bacterium]|nr:nucleoside monophosphate kinase [Candidatus Zambryskibacteria bacterium]